MRMISLHLIVWLAFGCLGAMLMAALADHRADKAEAQLEELEWAIGHWDIDQLAFDIHAGQALDLIA
jgi:hypothetical protein